MLRYLKSYFGYDSFRPLQEEIITHILNKQDCLVLMPTGGGKSICFQIPALMMVGTAVVVSPLISLMKDQVEALKANGIAAAALNSNYSEAENRMTREMALQGKLKLLYISPEKLLAEKDYLLKLMAVSLFAIDEAHCISQWGHDFRPEYTQLGQLRDEFPEVPIACFTATADKITKNDIVEQMRLRPCPTDQNDDDKKVAVFVSSFDRPNLSLDVRRGYTAKEKQRTLLALIDRHRGESGIIYCLSRKTTEKVAAELKGEGVNAAYYHAGMCAQDRDKVQSDFIHDRIQVVCATIAFGMGIDKSNVRFVVHYNMPKSIENYYQEIGRGGRDGLPCETVLFYNLSDIITLKGFADDSGQQEINNEKLDRMQEYAESPVCRRRILLNYFGETMDHDCCNCDVCKNPPQRFEGSVLVQKALSAVLRTGEKVGTLMAIDILRGMHTQDVIAKGYDKLKTFGAGHDVPLRDWKDYMLQMLHLGFVEIDYKDDSHLKVTELGKDVVFGRKKAELAVVKKEENAFVGRQRTLTGRSRLPWGNELAEAVALQEDGRLYDKLVVLRKKLAEEARLAPDALFADNILHELAITKPKSPVAFGRISGISEAKRESYAKPFVAVIRDHINPQNTIKHNGKEYTIDMSLYDCFLFWRDGLKNVYNAYIWNYYEPKMLSLNTLIPQDTPNRDAVVDKFTEIITDAYDGNITIDGDIVNIPIHVELDINGNVVHTLKCESFEDGMRQFREFVDTHGRYPFTHSDEYECSLRRWYQEMYHRLVPVTSAQHLAVKALRDLYPDIPKTKMAMEKK